MVRRAMLLVLMLKVPATDVVRLQRSVEQEQMEAVAPPPSSLVLQPLTGLAGPPHSLVTRVTAWKCPLVTRQVWEEDGQVTTQASWGLKFSQLAREEL